MTHQAICRVSVPLVLVMVKLVPAILAEMVNSPAVPLVFWPERKILLFAATVVLLTVTVPPTSVATPIDLFDPSSIRKPSLNLE